MFVSYCYLLSFRKLTTPFTLKRLLISKEEKELVNTLEAFCLYLDRYWMLF